MHLPHGVRFLIALSVGLLFLIGPIWFLVRSLKRGETEFFDTGWKISKKEHPILFWVMYSIWVPLAMFTFMMGVILVGGSILGRVTPPLLASLLAP
jgi:hypothetical protein